MMKLWQVAIISYLVAFGSMFLLGYFGIYFYELNPSRTIKSVAISVVSGICLSIAVLIYKLQREQREEQREEASSSIV